MTLVSRVSAFFLATLAIVLAGSSVALFASARAYLHWEVDDRLAGALAVLAAATEIHPEGVEWEPNERELTLGQGDGQGRLLWRVDDGEGRRVDRSRNLDAAADPLMEATGRAVDPRGEPWRVARRSVLPGLVPRESGSASAAESPRAARKSRGQFPASLVLTVAAPVGPVERALAALGGSLLGISVSAWLVAALVGRRLVRRALAPLARLVESARGLDPADSGWSLPVAGTDDELDELGRAFNDLLGRLRVGYERQRGFAGDASHQLRTPLTALIGQIDVALRRDRPAEEYRRVLRLVRGRAGQLAEIVEALLFLARADVEAGLPDAAPLAIAAWLARHLNAHALAGVIVPSIEVDEATTVVAYASLLGDLLDNLLENAARHGEDGGPIAVGLWVEGTDVVLSVEDQGPGIDPVDLPRVFEPFYRSARSRQLGRPGVGLGLAIVRRIAAAFGGTVSAESDPGRGARLVLRLPRVVPHSEPDPMTFTPGFATMSAPFETPMSKGMVPR